MVRRTSLRTKFLIRFLIAGLLPVAVFAIAGITLLYVARRSDIADLETKLIAQKQVEIVAFIDEAIETSKIVVGFESGGAQLIDFGYRVGAGYVPEVDAQKFLLEGVLREIPALVEVAMINSVDFKGLPPKMGAETKRVSRAADIPVDCVPPYREGGLLPCDFLLDFSETPLFKTAAGGKNYVGPVYWTQAGPMVTIAVPVRDKQNMVIAVLKGELSLRHIQELVARAQLGNEGYLFLVDTEGIVLAHSRNPKALRTDFLGNIAVRDLLTSKISRSGLEDSDIYENSQDAVVVGSSSFLRTLGWGLIAEWPYEDAFKPLYEFMNQILVVGLLMTGAVALFAVVLAYAVTKPIKLLRLSASRVGLGDFTHPVKLETKDELQDLSDSLNSMAQDLAQLQKLKEVEIRAKSLARALEKEKELSKAKDVFITTASHQLRTPVSAINWNTELLKDAGVTDEMKELVEGIASHSQFLNAIVNDLLNSASFGIGYTIAAKPQPISLSKVLEETLDGLQSEITSKQLTVKKEFPQEPLFIPGSYGALRVLSENLLANAVTYSTEKGEITLSVSKTQSPESGAGDNIMLRVRDSGIGIPKNEQRYLFTAFFRASNAVERKNVGTGLGLFIAKNIVDGHGGTIAVESEQNKGTTIIVAFPETSAPSEEKPKTS